MLENRRTDLTYTLMRDGHFAFATLQLELNMNAIPSPLPPFPNVTVATLRAERLTAALGFLNNNLAWLAESTATLQRPPRYNGEHLFHVERIAIYTRQAQHWTNLVSQLSAESARC